jgi:hypothetical protein
MATEPPAPDPRVIATYIDDVDLARPPDDLVDDDRVRLKLNGSPAEARLLGRDL